MKLFFFIIVFLIFSLRLPFSVFAQPNITSFSPLSANPGDVVTITGNNFNATTINNIVFFGATRATVTSATTNTVMVTVPLGASYSPITLLNTGNALASVSRGNFSPKFSPAKTNITSADFLHKQDFTTGLNPYFVAVSDLDGDGKPDLVVANTGSNTVSVYRNVSTSGSIITNSFAPKVDFITGTQPISIAVGDLDGDGKPDLAVANYGSSAVSVFRNTSSSGNLSTGSFAVKQDFAAGIGPLSVMIGDLDGDGKPDLAVTNSGNDNISVFRNTSASGSITIGSFAPKVDFTTGSNPYSLAIGDLDGDSKPDLVVVNANSNTVSLLRNTAGSGNINISSFAAKVDFVTGTQPFSVIAGDLDGDGKLDLAIANFLSSTVSVYRNTSTIGSINSGSFTAKVDFATGTNAGSVAIGDMDGNGKPDLAVANYSIASISVFPNIATSGSFTTSSFAPKQDFATGIAPLSILISDLDGDGRPELATANSNTSSISVLRNTSNNADLTSITSSSGTINPTFAAGITAYAVSVANSTGSITVTSVKSDANSSITVNGISVTSGSASGSIALNVGSNTIVIIVTAQNGSTKTYTITVHRAPHSITSFSPTSAQPGDTVTIAGTGFNSIAANNILFFGATRATATAVTATSLTVTVPIGATYAPISLLNISTSYTAISMQNFTPTYSPAKTSITVVDFISKQDFATGAIPYSVAIGDLDGDGKPDLAVVNSASNTVSVFRNTSESGSMSIGSFTTKVDFSTGAQPISVAIGDLDGDSKPDLVVANFDSKSVSVYRNTSTSGSINATSFAAKVDFTTGEGSGSVAIGDLDGDGKLDLVVANRNLNTLSVLHNRTSNGIIGSSSFASKVDFGTGAEPFSVAIGDFNGDGKPDLAVANKSSNNVSVYRNITAMGSINSVSFAPKVDFTTGTYPISLAIGDLDGDGKLDLALANNFSKTVSVLRNTANSGSIGNGSFAPKVDFANGLDPFSLTIGDVDGDGKPDLAVGSLISNTISVYRNTSISGSISSASFSTKVDFATSALPISVALGDLDGDGKPDLVIANANSNTFSVLRNTDLPPAITSFTPSKAKPGDEVVLIGANFNTIITNNIVFFGATRAMVKAASTTSLTVTVPSGATYAPITLLNTSTGLGAFGRSNFTPIFSPAKTNITASDFLPKQDVGAGEGIRSVVIGDLDGDGKSDFAVVNSPSNTVSVYRNLSTGGSITQESFAAKVDFDAGNGSGSVAIGDLDGDGKPDLVVANQFSNTVYVYRNTAISGSINTGSFASPVNFATGIQPNSIAICDLDGDGKPDLAVTNGYSATVSVYRNTAISGSITTGSFAPGVNFATGDQPYSLAIGDLDGDGKPDLAVANANSNTISVIRNTASSGSITISSFATKVDFSTDRYPSSLAIGDLDGDGKPDLVVANYLSSLVSVLRNTSTIGNMNAGSFASKVDFPTGSDPFSLALGDLNGDGKVDLAVANEGSNTISVIINTANIGSITIGSFAARVDFVTGPTTRSLTISDLDGDGKPDLAFSNNYLGILSVLRNADIIYTFTGSGNWDNAANWSGNLLPPATVAAFVQIVINPSGEGTCILNVPVTVPNNSSISVAPGKKFIIQGNLTISNQ